MFEYTILLANECRVHYSPNKNIFFTGRSNFIKQVESLLSENHKKTVTLVGSGGIGKTQIAKAFLHKNKQDYSIIWWVDAKKPIENGALQIAEQWNKTQGCSKLGKINVHARDNQITKTNFLRALCENRLSTLVILDDAYNENIVDEINAECKNNTHMGFVRKGIKKLNLQSNRV